MNTVKILFVVIQSDSKRILAARTSFVAAQGLTLNKFKQVRTEIKGITASQDGWSTAKALSNPINY